MNHYRSHGPTLPAMLEHSNFLTSLQDQTIGDGPQSSPNIQNSRQRSAISIGSFLLWDALVYCRWAWSATQNGLARPFARSSLRAKLNPSFTSWLMGWPRNLESARTPCDSQAMELFLFRQRMHLSRLLED